MTLFDILMVFALGWILGSNFTLWRLRKMLTQISSDYIDFIQKSSPNVINKDPIVAETEVHENTMYLYDRQNDTFLCQGSTLEELAERLMSWHKIKVAYVTHIDQTYYFVDGKVQNKL